MFIAKFDISFVDAFDAKLKKRRDMAVPPKIPKRQVKKKRIFLDHI